MEQATMASSSGDRSTKRNAEENKEQCEKKSIAEDEESGLKRSVVECEALAKKTKSGNE